MLAIIEFANVFAQIGASNAGMALDVHVIAQGQDDLLNLHGQLSGGGQAQDLSLAHSCVNGLKERNGKSGRLAGSRLSLGYDVPSFHDGLDGPLLNRRRLFKTCNSIMKVGIVFKAIMYLYDVINYRMHKFHEANLPSIPWNQRWELHPRLH